MPEQVMFASAQTDGSAPFLRFGGEKLRQFLVAAPRNICPAVEPYVYVFPVTDTRIFFDIASVDPASESYFLSKLNRDVALDLSRSRCILLIDISNEGIYYSKVQFNGILHWLKLNEIDDGRVIILNQNRFLEKAFRLDFPESNLSFFSYDYFVKSIPCVFSGAGYEANVHQSLQTQGLVLDHVKPAFGTSREFAFLCLNATPRPHRMLFLCLLKMLNVLPRTLHSFHGPDPSKGRQFNIEMAQKMATRLNLERSFVDLLSRLYEWAPAIADKFEQRGNDLALRIDPVAYEKSFASLVTETETTNGQMARITEKTIKPLFMGHPIIVYGNQGSLRIIRDLGFQTFSPFIDETYDDISNERDRFLLMSESISKLYSHIVEDDQRCLSALLEIAEYNYLFARNCFSAFYELKYEIPIIHKVRQLLRK